MIGLSPLSPGHRRTFQRTSVRPSTGSYPRFSLPRDSSPGFASAARDWSPPSDSLSLRLASQLNLAACQQLAGSFYKRHAVTPRGGAPTPCGRTVSGTVSLPSRGAFHLSLTVLVRYRSQESIQAWRVVPPASHRVSRVRRYSGRATARVSRFRLRGHNPVSPAFPCRSATEPLCHRAGGYRGPPRRSPHNPGGATPARCTLPPVWPWVPVRSPLLGESRLISLPRGT